MPDVDHVGLRLLKQSGEGAVHLPVAVAVAGVAHVDDVQRDPRVRGIGLPLQLIFGQEGVLLPGEDVDLVAVRQSLVQALGVDLGAGVVPHGVAVDDLERFHGRGRQILSY